MIDIHAHINDPDFNGDREKVIKRTLDAGVRIIIDSSIDYESGILSLQLSKHYKGIIFTTLGMDPVLDEYEKVAELIKENRDRIVGVGEVGFKQQLAEVVPLENMLLESDSPVLGPKRGKRNEPKNLVLTLSKLSKIKQVSEKELEYITDANARKVFGI